MLDKIICGWCFDKFTPEKMKVFVQYMNTKLNVTTYLQTNFNALKDAIESAIQTENEAREFRFACADFEYEMCKRYNVKV